MAGEVQATGKGFLTSGGQVKDRKTLEAEKTQEAKKAREAKQNEGAVESDVSDKSVGRALGSVKSRFTEQANSFINTVNSSDARLKKAEENVKAQQEKAKELKAAIEKGDQESASKKKQELEQLQKERDLIAKDIESDNAEKTAERRKTLKLGNQERAVVEVKKAEFAKTDKNQNLDSAEGVDSLISSLAADKAKIKTQRDDIKEVKKEVDGVVKNVKKDLDRIEKSAISSINEAKAAAEKVAGEIVKAGSQASLVSNINEQVVKSLVGP